MTTRADVDRLTAAQRRLVDLAKADLARLFGGLNLSRPEAARDALLEIVPALVSEYGNLAATAAAEWYEQIRPGQFLARTAPTAPAAAVQGSVRNFADGLFGGDPETVLQGLSGAMQRHIAYSSRETVARNAQRDPLKPRFARVPRGARTCAWCSMLASRGFVYHSRETAGIIADHFHDDCNCQIVASFDRGEVHIAGYDPDRWYAMYLEARDTSGAGTDRDIAAVMRRMFPDEFTDGVHTHDA